MFIINLIRKGIINIVGWMKKKKVGGDKSWKLSWKRALGSLPCIWLYTAITLVVLFWPCCVAYRILIPQPEIELTPPAFGAGSLNHWTASKVPTLVFILNCVSGLQWFGLVNLMKKAWAPDPSSNCSLSNRF